MAKSKKPELTNFQRQLLKNIITGEGILRHGGSAPVQELVDSGMLEKATEGGATCLKPTDKAVKAVTD